MPPVVRNGWPICMFFHHAHELKATLWSSWWPFTTTVGTKDMRFVQTTRGVWYTKPWLSFVQWWLVGKTHQGLTKEEIFLENCTWAQRDNGKTKSAVPWIDWKFKKALKAVDEECITWLHALNSRSRGSMLEHRPVMLHFQAQFPGLFSAVPWTMCILNRAGAQQAEGIMWNWQSPDGSIAI